MTEDQMMEEARHVIEAVEAEGFVLMGSKEGTSFYLQEPDVPAELDENGNDVRSRLVMRMQAETAFRAAVKAFILAERPYGATT